ncbi:MAG: VCBS repeat-containing protein [Flavobacteriaceae bacterium]
MAAADFNNDGLVDLYYRNQVADQLYRTVKLRNEDITQKSGINNTEGWSNGVSIVDINQDGWMDIYMQSRELQRNSKRLVWKFRISGIPTMNMQCDGLT